MTAFVKLLNKKLFASAALSAALICSGCSGSGEEEPVAEVEQDVTFKNLKAATESSDRQYREVPEPQTIVAPDFELPRLEGGTFKLSDYEGYIVLVDFWATWCGPCRMTIPHLIKVYEEFKGDKVVVVGISLDRGGRGVVEKFVDQYKISYPIVLGNAQVVADYGNFQNIPVSFLINAQGEVVNRHVGFRPRQVYESDIRTLLKQTNAPG